MMNWIDIILLIVMIMSIATSIQRGLIISSLDLLSWIGSFLIAFLTYSTISSTVQQYIPALSFWAVPLTFVLLVTITRLLLDSLSYSIIKNVPHQTHLSLPNRLLGIIPGTINGLIWAAVFSSLLFFLPFSSQISKDIQEAKMAESLIGKVYWLQDKLYPVFSDALNHSIKTNPKLGKEESFKLPYTVKKPKVRPDLEAQMLVMVNEERSQRGLKTLKADPEMTLVARKHAADMFARGYFSHLSPEGSDPFDRMRKGKIDFLAAGENLALAQTLRIAHTGLMNSPGHRANILNPKFGRLGIGILDGGIYGYMITQNFRN
jgi:uncharacterized protein YkwD